MQALHESETADSASETLSGVYEDDWLDRAEIEAGPEVAARLDAAIMADRGRIALRDVGWMFGEGATDATTRQMLAARFATLEPPGWQDVPLPVTGQSLTALTPTAGRVLAGLLAALALLVLMALVSLPSSEVTVVLPAAAS